MRKKNNNFLVINNGLKSQNGHYYETGVSVCQACNNLGLNACMATNKAFAVSKNNINPFSFYPVFEVDHWQSDLLNTIDLNNNLNTNFHFRFKNKIKKLCNFVWKPFLFLELKNKGFSEEFRWMKSFYANLKDFLLPFKDRPSVVFFPTAHARELFAVVEFNQKFNENNKFSFHLEFRHPIKTIPSDCNYEYWNKYRLLNDVWFNHIATPLNNNIFLYCDTPELAKEYEDEFKFEFGTLPIPFRSFLLEKKHSHEEKLILGYFGDARDEKGFEHLPIIHKYFSQQFDLQGKYKFLIQCTNANYWDGGRKVLNYFKKVNPEEYELLFLEKPMTDIEYYDNFSKADICLLPYDPGIYRSRSSGCLSEAIALGIPSVVPNNTWMANQLPKNCGGFFNNITELCEQSYEVVKRYNFYLNNMKIFKQAWIAKNNPEELVKKIISKSFIQA